MPNRSFDGSGNNIGNPDWGRAETQLLRLTVPHAYDDGFRTPRKGTNARGISNLVCREEAPRLNAFGLSDFVWAWGQYLDHELDITPLGSNGKMSVSVGPHDPYFPDNNLEIERSDFDAGTGGGPGSPGEQKNGLSAFIDATNVYGQSEAYANKLRANDGTGKLRVSPGDLLPYKDAAETEFIAGDVRANENPILLALHTLSVREHNRRCDKIGMAQPGLSDDERFQRARRYVGALHQVITYKEFLPALLGALAPDVSSDYDDGLDPSISNIFATVGFRLGHSMLSERIRIENLDAGSPVRDGPKYVALADSFGPGGIDLIKSKGIEPFLAGLMQGRMREVDTAVVESVRSFLFKNTMGVPFLHDLAATNIMRGRDHGFPDYLACREAMRKQISKGHIRSRLSVTSSSSRYAFSPT